MTFQDSELAPPKPIPDSAVFEATFPFPGPASLWASWVEGRRQAAEAGVRLISDGPRSGLAYRYPLIHPASIREATCTTDIVQDPTGLLRP